MSSSLRIAFVAYRGNMRCGGQGVYLWFLARELARQGHRVDVWVGPPYPDPMPFAHSVNELRNHQYWGKWFSKDRRALIPSPRTRLLNPLEFYELGAMLQGDAFHLPFADATFDKVICSEVMEHVHDFTGAARELARVLRPGGLAAVTIPTATSEHLYLHVGDDYFESPGGHIRVFRPRELARGLARAGLATTGVGFAHALHTPYWLLRSVAGLTRADESALVRAYRRFLIRSTVSPAMTRLERALNYFCPKSVILYAEKRSTAARAA